MTRFAELYSEEAGQALLHVATVKTLPDIKMTTPIDFGFLRAANRVLGPDVAPGRTGIVFYNPMEYAAPVHEILTAHHPTGTPKFIEWPLMRDLEEYPREVLTRSIQLVRRAAGV